MFRVRPIRLGSLAGIPVAVHPTWLLVFGLVSWSLATGYYPLEFPGRPVWLDVVSGLVTSLLFFACLLAHEVGHSIVARGAGIDVQRITLFLFGGVSELAEEPRTPAVEARMAAAGPGASVVLGAAFFAVFRLSVAVGLPSAVWAPLATLASANAVIALFNVAPAFPMDGGRLLRSLMWWATGDKLLSTRIASLIGQAMAAALAVAGAWTAVMVSLSGLWLVLLGAFLARLASRAYTGQLPRLRAAGTPVGAVMGSPAGTVSASAPASQAVALLMSSPSDPILAVVEGDRVVGILTLDSAARALAGDPDATAGRAAARPDPTALVDAEESLDSALRRFGPRGPEALLVVRGGRLAGQLSPEHAGRALAAAGAPR